MKVIEAKRLGSPEFWAPSHVVTFWNDHLSVDDQDEVVHQFELAAKTLQ